MTEEVRVRFAPSPTGYLHVGGARTALFNWLFARHLNGRFILRIEDTDRERSKKEYEEAIIRDLQWLGMDWDEGPGIGGPYGPYQQTDRAPQYREQLKKLLASGGAYPCFCSHRELDAEREAVQALGKPYRYSGKCRALTREESDALKQQGKPYSIRLKVEAGATSFSDLVRGDVTVDHQELDDFILVRTGGEPTYNFVNVVDDALMRITHVIRGDDHLSNTPKQILLYRALGFTPPKFAHLSLIVGPDRAPLSKRHGANSVQEFKRQGYLPEALVNYLALLGWSLDDKTELFSRQELIHDFDLGSVQKSPAGFDYAKLQWMNGHYIRASHIERIYQLCLEWLWDNDAISETFMREGGPALKRMIQSVQGSLKTIADVGDQITYFLGEVHTYDPVGMGKYCNRETLGVLEEGLKILNDTVVFNEMMLEEKFRGEAATRGRKFADYVHPMRLAITGRLVSPNLFEIIEIMGKGRCMVRLKRFIQMIKNAIGTSAST